MYLVLLWIFCKFDCSLIISKDGCKRKNYLYITFFNYGFKNLKFFKKVLKPNSFIYGLGLSYIFNFVYKCKNGCLSLTISKNRAIIEHKYISSNSLSIIQIVNSKIIWVAEKFKIIIIKINSTSLGFFQIT